MVKVKGKANYTKLKKKLVKKEEKTVLKAIRKKMKKGDLRGINMMMKRLRRDIKSVKY